jgi:geranylgeranyl pyrophosphate synthase
MSAGWASLISTELETVERELRETTRSADAELNDVVDHALFPGGKRIRPAVAILSYFAAGGRDPRVIVPAAGAIELIHTATLIHDDINDGARIRRGREAAHLRFSPLKAIVAGDFLFVKAYETSANYDKTLMHLTARVAAQLAEGEFVQSRALRRPETGEAEYVGIVEKKTALPLSLSARIGGHLAGTGHDEPLAAYGYNLGIAFQIVDDVLDVVGKEEMAKKSLGLDVSSGTPNLVLIRAMNDGTDSVRLRKLFAEPQGHEKEILDLVASSDGVAYARRRAAEFCRRSVEEARRLPAGAHRDALVDLAEFVAKRES